MTVVVEMDGAVIVTGAAPAGTVVVAVPIDTAGQLPQFGEAAQLDVGTTVGTVAAGDDSRFNQVQRFVKYPAGVPLTKFMAVSLLNDVAYPTDTESVPKLLGYLGIVAADCEAGDDALIQVSGKIDFTDYGFENGGSVFTVGNNGGLAAGQDASLPLLFSVAVGIFHDDGYLYLSEAKSAFYGIESLLGIQGIAYGFPYVFRVVPEFLGGTGADNPADARNNLQASYMTQYPPYNANSPCESPYGFYVDGDQLRVFNGSVWKTVTLNDWI